MGERVDSLPRTSARALAPARGWTTPPQGLGATARQLEHLCRDDSKAMDALQGMRPLAEAGEIGNGRESRGADVTPTRGSNSASYLIRRLQRDAPEIAEALAAGEYRSARVAGIAAGIVKVPTGLDELNRAWRKASKTERAESRAASALAFVTERGGSSSPNCSVGQ